MDDKAQLNHAGNEFEFAALSEARHYRKAIVSVFGPYTRGETLEVGCGIGQFTQDLHEFSPSAKISGLEPDPAFHPEFRANNPNIPLLTGTASELKSQWDCIVSVNVLEHIKDDAGELQIYQKLLQKGGHLCLFTPARQEIYAPLDAKFGHFRRYSKQDLKQKIEAAGFRIVMLEYFNPIGYLSWLVVCKWMGSQKFSYWSMRLFDRCILPVSLVLGRLTGNPIGQSVIVVAVKPD